MFIEDQRWLLEIPMMCKLTANRNPVGLDTVALILWAEKYFGIEIPDEDVTEILTVGQLCWCIAGRVAAKDGTRALSYRVILEQVANRLVAEYDVPPELITERAQFVKDLGLD
jgi:acyl carrier protein